MVFSYLYKESSFRFILEINCIMTVLRLYCDMLYCDCIVNAL